MIKSKGTKKFKGGLMKLKATVLMLILFLSFSGIGFADEFLLSLNNQYIQNDDFIEIENGIAYGSVSEFAKRFGVQVDWYSGPMFAVLYRDGVYTTFRMNSDTITINNVNHTLPYATISKNGRTYAPLDYLQSYFGFVYRFDSDLSTLHIECEQLEWPESQYLQMRAYTDEDLLWLARIIEAESAHGSLTKKTAIANVVLNRVDDPRFPDTIYEVIFQRNQFPPAYRANFTTREPSESSFLAAKRALLGFNVVDDCLYFNYIPHTQRGLVFYDLIEGDYFYTQPM